MRNIFFGIFSLAVLLSCKKFDHSAQNETVTCTLCAFADSLEGVYKGIYNSYAPPPPGTQGDTFLFSVEHIFLNQGNPIDSMYMFLKVHREYQTAGYGSDDTLMLLDNAGNILSEYDIFYIRPDSMKMYHKEPNKMGGYLVVDYTGYK